MNVNSDEFWLRADVGEPDKCWEWKGVKRNGYGRFCVNKKYYTAHRIAYSLFYGTDISNTKVLHHCDNPSCVNPHHLFLGTQQDNIKDMIAKGRHRYPIGTKVHTAKLTEVQVIKIRNLHKTTPLSEQGIAEVMGVSKSAVKHILHGRSWAWLE